MSHDMTPACACCAPVPLRSGLGLNRRGFLNLGAAGVAAGATVWAYAPAGVDVAPLQAAGAARVFEHMRQLRL